MNIPETIKVILTKAGRNSDEGSGANARDEPRGPRHSWPLLRALTAYWAWQIGTKVLMGVIYIAVISEGLRLLVPSLGQRLYKLPIPGSVLLEGDEVRHRIDLAHCLALFLLLGVLYLWVELLRFWLRPDAEVEEGWDADKYRQLITGLGVTILGADGCLFYFSVAQMDWSGGEFSLIALLATAAYIAVLILTSFLTLKLKQKVIDSEARP